MQRILYIEINHLRKAEPIQLYQILNKSRPKKKLKIPKMYFSLFSSFEAKFDKLNAKNREQGKSIPSFLVERCGAVVKRRTRDRCGAVVKRRTRDR